MTAFGMLRLVQQNKLENLRKSLADLPCTCEIDYR
jgi:hypothetical protein